jgi:hypothetical protein
MRVGPDALPIPSGESNLEASDPDHERPQMDERAPGVSDPDMLVARPEIEGREAWAAQVAGYGGLAFSSDRLEALDERGLELTRAGLQPSTPTPFVPYGHARTSHVWGQSLDVCSRDASLRDEIGEERDDRADGSQRNEPEERCREFVARAQHVRHTRRHSRCVT